MKENWNPFKIVHTESGPMQAGLLPDATLLKLGQEELHTAVLVGEPGEPGGQNIMKLSGLWGPPIGARIQVGEPNRNLVVHDVEYQIAPDGLWALVHVQDSMERVYDPTEEEER